MTDHARRSGIRAGRRSILGGLALTLAACGGEGAQPPDDTTSIEAEAPAPDPIVGSWSLATIDMNDGEHVSPDEDRVPMVDFSDEATPTGSRWLSGSGGCTRFTGAYDAGGSGRFATAGRMVISAGRCSESELQVANLFVIGLESATSYEIANDTLSMEFGGGTLRLVRTP